MLELDEALQAVLSKVETMKSEKVPLAQSLFRALSRDVVSDINAPPHDKAMVDGFAVRSADVTEVPIDLQVVGSTMAGETNDIRLEAGQAVRIMTGAPIPAEADAVVMREATSDPPADAATVTIKTHVKAEANIVRKAALMAVGDAVLSKSARIRAIEIGLLSEVGCHEVPVVGACRASVLAVGNEIVPIQQLPPAGKIRNSNGPMLCAMARASGCHAFNLGIVADRPEEMRRPIQKGLDFNFLILSGGVSAGDLDLVPNTLKELGVQEVFHKVRIKPGKPVWFGVGPQGTLVFGLPGNPVSSLVCFALLVRPAIQRASGRTDVDCDRGIGIVQGQAPKPTDRRTFWPARTTQQANGDCHFHLLPWQGASDLRTLADADCFVDLQTMDPVTKLAACIELF